MAQATVQVAVGGCLTEGLTCATEPGCPCCGAGQGCAVGEERAGRAGVGVEQSAELPGERLMLTYACVLGRRTQPGYGVPGVAVLERVEARGLEHGCAEQDG